jgi:thiamine-monophosphate kinase
MMNIERTWINRLQTKWPGVDLRHDTFYDPATRQILTSDMMVEGVHFSWDYFKPADVGWRSVAINLSDIAATGGTPRWVMVSIGIPPQQTLQHLEGLYQGIEECCQKFNCTVVGGDTVQSAKTIVSVSILGMLSPTCQPGRRNTAEPGHIVATSGPHGLSQAGLEALQRHLGNYPKAKLAHLRPIPLLRLGQRIAQVLPRFAMMDSSDGLADAAMRLAEASNVDIILDKKYLMVHPDVAQIAADVGEDPFDWVLYGGEDFQLVVTLPPEAMAVLPEFHVIGYVQAPAQPGRGQAFLREDQAITPLDPEKTFQHFPSPPDMMPSSRVQEGSYS